MFSSVALRLGKKLLLQSAMTFIKWMRDSWSLFNIFNKTEFLGSPISMATPKRALFIGAIFFLVTATINVSLLPVHSTTSCLSSTTYFFGISLEKNSFKSNSYFIRQPATIRLTKRLLVIAKVRRTQRACALYCNSALTFRPLLKLIFDIELNPGPNGSFNRSVKANTRNTDQQRKDCSP